MARPPLGSGSDARSEILAAALRQFAHNGYAGASVQDIVSEAKVTKPVLYYHFGSKEGLYTALVDWAADERWRRSFAAAERGQSLAEKYSEIIAATFEFVLENRELTRLGLATVFAAPGEVPNPGHCQQSGRRVFDLMLDLAKKAQQDGELTSSMPPQELAIGIYGMMHFHVLLYLVTPDQKLDGALAKRIVQLFLSGAAAQGSERRHAG
jgi:AcrR family transcriptional regulator